MIIFFSLFLQKHKILLLFNSLFKHKLTQNFLNSVFHSFTLVFSRIFLFLSKNCTKFSFFSSFFYLVDNFRELYFHLFIWFENDKKILSAKKVSMLYGSTTYAAGIQLTTKLWKILSRLTLSTCTVCFTVWVVCALYTLRCRQQQIVPKFPPTDEVR